jgi:hypothetical protein
MRLLSTSNQSTRSAHSVKTAVIATCMIGRTRENLSFRRVAESADGVPHSRVLRVRVLNWALPPFSCAHRRLTKLQNSANSFQSLDFRVSRSNDKIMVPYLDSNKICCYHSSCFAPPHPPALKRSTTATLFFRMSSSYFNFQLSTFKSVSLSPFPAAPTSTL